MDEYTSPTDYDVREILREEFGTRYDSIIEKAMDSIGRKYGSWRGFHTFTHKEMSDFITKYITQETRQIGNGC
jgi:predicted ArsR family transcriptional regulator